MAGLKVEHGESHLHAPGCQTLPLPSLGGLAEALTTNSGDENVSEQQNDQSVHHRHAPAPADVYLYSLMAILDADETNQSSVSVTLMVGGGVVCGDLISHGRWRGEVDAMMTGVSGTGAELVTRMMGAIDEELGPREEGQPFNFVHLRKARIVTNYRATMGDDVQQGPEFPLWRTRLSDVQGWTFGRPS